MAWLHAAPGEQTVSRMELYRTHNDEHPYLDMPELLGGEYLIEWLFELGVSRYTGMGTVPLDYQEIQAGIGYLDLTPWELQMLRELSTEYVSFSQKAMKEDCPPPTFSDKMPSAAEPATKTLGEMRKQQGLRSKNE